MKRLTFGAFLYYFLGTAIMQQLPRSYNADVKMLQCDIRLPSDVEEAAEHRQQLNDSMTWEFESHKWYSNSEEIVQQFSSPIEYLLMSSLFQ